MKTFADFVSEAKSRIVEIQSGELRGLIDSGRSGWVLLDVRETDEVKVERIDGALHIPLGVLEGQIGGPVPDRDAKIVVYCRSGNRSALAADTLQEMGYRNVVSLAKGIDGWNADASDWASGERCAPPLPFGKLRGCLSKSHA